MSEPIADRVRRALIGAAASWFAVPADIRAQAPARKVGFLVAGTRASHGRWVAALVGRLAELGWVDGRNLAIDYRWAEGRLDVAEKMADELVRARVEVLVTSGTAYVTAAKRATQTIPIVFAAAGDPVGTGLVASLAHPGGNVTGLSIQQTDLAAKRLELLRALVPKLTRLGVLSNSGGASAQLDARHLEAAARAIGMLDVVAMEIRRREDIALAFEAVRERVDAVYVVNDPLVDSHRAQIQALALAARLPAMYGSREHVESGGLVSYGASFSDLFRRGADLVDRILRGARPADLPVEQPTKFELVLNLRTAEQLGIAVPKAVLALADDVIR